LPRVVVDKQVHEFGDAGPEETLKGQFRLANAGTADLEIGRLRIDCVCARLRIDGKRIAPGGCALLEVEYDTPRTAGPIASNILVETNLAGEGRYLHLKVTGKVVSRGGKTAEVAAATTEPAGQARPATRPSSPPEPGSLRVVAMYSPTCAGCDRMEKALEGSERRWGSRVWIDRRLLDDVANFRDLLVYEDHYGSTESAAPKFFIGGQYLAGVKDITDRLDQVIECELARGSVTFFPDAPSARPAGGLPSEILARFQGFSVGAVAVAGLIDGINPCAFTTIIFFLSMLAYLGKSRRQMALVGVGFTASVFATYLLLGLGALGAVKVFSVRSGVSTGLSYAVAGLAFVLAGWSLVDFVRYVRTRDVKTATLGLPDWIKQRIHKVIRVGLSTRGLVAGSVSVGFLVAILESVCTGQVYLPTIVFVARAPGLRAGALGYLVLYNVMFILPLVAILIVAYMGVKSDTMGALLRRRLGLLKLAMAILFAGLGLLVLATV